MRYLKNNGLPTKVTIYNNKEVIYKEKADKERSNFKMWKVQVIMWRGEGDLESDNAEAKKFGISRSEKMIRRHQSQDGGKNFRYIDERRVQLNHSFQVDDYPHLVGFKIGFNESDEREYTILCGQTAKVENNDDAKTILDKVGFIDEVDEKGNVIFENRWRKDKEEAENRNPHLRERNMPSGLETFERKMRTPEDKRITQLEENEEVG